jgi:hypothetical protein
MDIYFLPYAGYNIGWLSVKKIKERRSRRIYHLMIFQRIPKWQELAPVYAIISLILYSWTLLWFFWKLPSWLYFLSLPEILTNVAYMFATNFVESILVLLGIILLSALLPKSLFSSAFVARGVSIVILGLGYMMYLAFQFGDREDYPSQLVRLIPLVFLLSVVIAFLIGRTGFLRKAIEDFADRAIILLYLLLPLSVLSIGVVIFRNIF